MKDKVRLHALLFTKIGPRFRTLKHLEQSRFYPLASLHLVQVILQLLYNFS